MDDDVADIENLDGPDPLRCLQSRGAVEEYMLEEIADSDLDEAMANSNVEEISDQCFDCS